MAPTTVSVFLLAVLCLVYGDEEHKPTRSLDCVNVYWRRYGKIIPVDAVGGGHDKHGKELYVGRGAIENSGRHLVTPLSINTTAEVQMGPLLKAVPASNVEILCANPLSEVRWVKVSCRDTQNILAREQPIVAGVDFNSPLYKQSNIYVGRIKYEGELLVGKVILYDHEKLNQAAMYFISNNRLINVLEEDIEILVANL